MVPAIVPSFTIEQRGLDATIVLNNNIWNDDISHSEPAIRIPSAILIVRRA
jgi:hypothetical protein